jgi:hypothetical protein
VLALGGTSLGWGRCMKTSCFSSTKSGPLM